MLSKSITIRSSIKKYPTHSTLQVSKETEDQCLILTKQTQRSYFSNKMRSIQLWGGSTGVVMWQASHRHKQAVQGSELSSVGEAFPQSTQNFPDSGCQMFQPLFFIRKCTKNSGVNITLCVIRTNVQTNHERSGRSFGKNSRTQSKCDIQSLKSKITTQAVSPVILGKHQMRIAMNLRPSNSPV